MAQIFISYRQEDAKGWAVLIRDELAKAFGDDQVFLDKDALGAGRWHDQLQAALDRCKIFLVVVGRSWVNLQDASGQRRLWVAGDVHREEIALALSRTDVTVIPVRVDGASLPTKDDLPGDLRSLLDQQWHELSDGRQRREVDLRRLIGDIEAKSGLKARQVRGSLIRKRHWTRPSFLAATAAIVVVVALGVYIARPGQHKASLPMPSAPEGAQSLPRDLDAMKQELSLTETRLKALYMPLQHATQRGYANLRAFDDDARARGYVPEVWSKGYTKLWRNFMSKQQFPLHREIEDRLRNNPRLLIVDDTETRQCLDQLYAHIDGYKRVAALWDDNRRPGSREDNVSTVSYPTCFDAYVDRTIDRLKSKRVELQAEIEHRTNR